MRLGFPVIILAALTAMSAPLVVSAKDTPAAALSDGDEALVERAINRGQLMYAYDQAAWHGTDDLRAKLPDFATRVDGWVVDGPRDAPHLIFYSNDKDNPKAVYVADFRDNKLLSSKVLGPEDDTALTPSQLKLIDVRRRALEALLKSKLGFCAKATPNSIILPPESAAGPYLVYFMTPQINNDGVPLGGHYLFEVSVDGSVRKPRAFTKACMEMPIKGTPRQKDTVAMGVTHLLDPVPTEIHVFTSLAANLPIYVITARNGRIWATDITGGDVSVRLVDSSKK